MHKLIAATLLALSAQPIQAQYSAGREVTFTVRVENVSTGSLLKLSNGSTAPAPTAPLLWTITDAGNPIFTAGVRDAKHGLQQLAEDGNPGVLADFISQHMKSVLRSGVVAIPMGDKSAGPITPGKSYDFTVAAAPGQRLSLAFMFGQSNDLFYGSSAKGIALFDAKGKPLSVDVTSQLALWDAGTEVNEEPGLGPNQAPRQPAPGAGTKEHMAIAAVHDKFSYPKITDVIRVTIAAAAISAER